jgi:hypothetical protein
VLRNVIRLVRPLVGWLVPLDEHVWMHRQIAYSILFWTIVHTTAHCEQAVFARPKPRTTAGEQERAQADLLNLRMHSAATGPLAPPETVQTST